MSDMEKKESEVVIEKSTSESSSIGVPSESDDDNDDDEVEITSGGSKIQSAGGSTLDSLASLEDCLPFKRGLSNYYNGKSKSFGNLGNIGVEEEMGKNEHVLNKKRRLIISHKWRANKKTSAHIGNYNNNNNIVQQSSMPDLLSATIEDEHNEQEEEDGK